MPSPSVTYNFSNGSTADADQVDTNFNDIILGITDGTKDLSISALTVAGNLTLSGTLVSTVLPTNATYDLGGTSNTFKGVYLDNGVTDGGGVYFNASTSAFLKANAAGTVGQFGGFTELTGTTVINMLNCVITYSASAGTITKSVNVTSITDGGVGVFTINFTTAFADANYMVAGSHSGNGYIDVSTRLTTSLQVVSEDNTGANIDVSYNALLIVGNRA